MSEQIDADAQLLAWRVRLMAGAERSIGAGHPRRDGAFDLAGDEPLSAYGAGTRQGSGEEAKMMDDRRLSDLVKRRQAWLEAIRPFQKVISYIYAIKIPSYTIHADGSMETNYNFTDAELKCIERANEAIAYLATKYGLKEKDGTAFGPPN